MDISMNRSSKFPGAPGLPSPIPKAAAANVIQLSGRRRALSSLCFVAQLHPFCREAALGSRRDIFRVGFPSQTFTAEASKIKSNSFPKSSFVIFWSLFPNIPSGKRLHSYGKSPFSMGKSTISMAMFNSFLYVYQRVFPTYSQRISSVSTATSLRRGTSVSSVSVRRAMASSPAVALGALRRPL